MVAATVIIDLSVEDAQECASTLRSTIKRIDWVLENNPPRKAGEAERMDERAKTLTIIANHIEEKLHERALKHANQS